jgi:Putative MetA-pathway of phenol degradation
VEFPIKIVRDDTSGTEAGAGDFLLGVKWRFLNNEKSHLQFGIYPQVLVPRGDREGSLGGGRAAFVLPLLAQKSWDKWTVYGNVGYWWQNAAGNARLFLCGCGARA